VRLCNKRSRARAQREAESEEGRRVGVIMPKVTPVTVGTSHPFNDGTQPQRDAGGSDSEDRPVAAERALAPDPPGTPTRHEPG
jgi:hypothetical protein